MTVAAVIGSQWGDEGKGKVVDILADKADMVVRYQGGNNAGHTLVVNGKKTIFHLIPSGILRPNATCVLAQGLVINLEVLCDEIAHLKDAGIGADRLLLSDRAHIILPHHLLLDRLREEAKSGSVPVGSTLRGIGPCYEDKIGRRGIRVGDLLNEERAVSLLRATLTYWEPMLRARGAEVPDAEQVIAALRPFVDELRPRVCDTTAAVYEAVTAGRHVLLEGAQGAMLDIDHGTYPFVTSSNCIAGAACTGIGLGPTAIDHVTAIVKAYTTRVGAGPFPTELDDAVGQHLRDAGAEYGSTTGRPRRCGWFDAVLARRVHAINGTTSLALTKLDVLTGLDEVKICVAYELNGTRIDTVPFDGLDQVVPVYETLPGWHEDISGIARIEDLPSAARTYVERIAQLCGCPLGLVSVGPDRDDTIVLDPVFS